MCVGGGGIVYVGGGGGGVLGRSVYPNTFSLGKLG